MSTIGQLYKQGKTGATVRKTFLVPLSEIYIEEGYNVREIDKVHAEEFRDAFIAGEYVPPLAVRVTDRGVKVIDGHHRYYGARMATDAGHEIVRLECKDFTGSEADSIAYMVTSSQGKALTALERASAYMRLRNQGWSNDEIAKKVKRSSSDVAQHLQLLECDNSLIDMVRRGEMSHSTALEMQRKHGTEATEVAKKSLAIARESGKSRVTKKALQKGVSPKKIKRLVSLICSAQQWDQDGSTMLAVDKEALDIIREIKESEA